MNRILTFLLVLWTAVAGAQNLSEGLVWQVETQASFSDGTTPLWLNANRHGLSSLEKSNGYVRGSLMRPLAVDSARRAGLGYGVDLVVASRYTSDVFVQQAFIESRWLHGTLTVGSKEYPMELKNQELSSGSQTLGINARPVPQVRLALPDYWTLPVLGGWLHLKGHVAYGWFTDEHWQHRFTERSSRFTDGALYHSKAGYLKIGKEGRPLSVELGLEMAAQFGGSSYRPIDGGWQMVPNKTGLGAFWDVLVPGGSDVGETVYQNADGNQLGSWVARVNWEAPQWQLGVYADHFFEDHSAMFLLDYDGYGTGDDWNVRKKNRYFRYDLKDLMLGVELQLRNTEWLRGVVVEYLYTKYQSGPLYHDHTPSMPDHISGLDNYYNHSIYPGWQHWGQVMGNPLYRSPIYNDDHTTQVSDNRFVAWHLGLNGAVSRQVDYRLMATWQEGLGTYATPYLPRRRNVSMMAEATWRLAGGWRVKGALGLDRGKLIGNNMGLQVTITKRGLL